MGYPAVTYSFVNGTTADASNVNTNFTDIISGLSDGTKDLNVSAITVGGVFSSTGNLAFGDTSADTVTFNASLASTILVNANASYNIGAAGTGLASVYLGSAGGLTTRLVGGATSSSWSMTFPTSAGSSKYVLETNGSGVTSWTSRTVLATQTKTTTYTILVTDDIVLCDASGSSFTVTLPTVATSTGKTIRVTKTDSDATKVVTIDGDGSETINGAANTTLNTQYESVLLYCNGTTWFIIDRKYPAAWVDDSASLTAANFGTSPTLKAWTKRDGDSLLVRGYIIAGATPSSTAASGYIGLPAKYTIDSAKAGTTYYLAGHSTEVFSSSGSGQNFGSSNRISVCFYDNSNVDRIFFASAISVGSYDKKTAAGILGDANGAIIFNFSIPISGWKD